MHGASCRASGTLWCPSAEDGLFLLSGEAGSRQMVWAGPVVCLMLCFSCAFGSLLQPCPRSAAWMHMPRSVPCRECQNSAAAPKCPLFAWSAAVPSLGLVLGWQSCSPTSKKQQKLQILPSAMGPDFLPFNHLPFSPSQLSGQSCQVNFDNMISTASIIQKVAGGGSALIDIVSYVSCTEIKL